MTETCNVCVVKLPPDLRDLCNDCRAGRKPARYFHLTAGLDPEQAIRSVEDRGFRVLGAALYAGDSLPVLGICEVVGRVVKENRQGGPKDDRERRVEVTGGACPDIEFSRPGVKP